MAAKLEINVRALLGTCEQLIKEQDQQWRLPSYIRNLDQMVNELESYDTADRKNIAKYQDKLLELKSQINYVEPLDKSRLKRKNENENIFTEIKQINYMKHETELRKHLFDLKDSSGVRYRGPSSNFDNTEKYYESIQEKLGDEMLALTRNLKEQTITASKIIKKDTDVMARSVSIANQNIGSLEKESKKLDEHTRRACKCWLWMMIGFVVVIFIIMILFMKLMKKK